MKKSIYQLETLTCPSCVRRIEMTLAKMDGINHAEVKFNSSRVEIMFDEHSINEDVIGKTITKLGYQIIHVK